MKVRWFIFGRLEALLACPKIAFACGELFFSLLGWRSKHRETQLADIRRILVIRLDDIGDLVLCSPFLRELRGHCPTAWITLVVKPLVYNLVELCPYVNEIVTLDARIPSRPFARLSALRLAALSLWRRRIQVVLNPRRDRDYYNANLLAYLSGAPLRIGYSESLSDGNRESDAAYRRRLLTTEFNNNHAQHEVDHNLDFLRFLGASISNDSLELWLCYQDACVADALLGTLSVKPGEQIVALAPGAGHAMKLWPAAKFRELASRIQRLVGVHIVVIGGPGDASLGNFISEGLGSQIINLAGKTTVRQMAAVIKRCHIFVGNDSGPMHVAAALKVPVVELCPFARSGSPAHVNSPTRFGPWRVPALILQPEQTLVPCSGACQANFSHCITQIRVEDALAAVLALLKKT